MAGHGMIGKQLGNYTIKALIGEGGMGAVYSGEHRFLGDEVAIKVLHGTYANNPKIAQRFFQEAKSARDIGHPSIIKVIDFGQSDDGCLYLVMELLKGRSLAQLMSQGALGEELSARIVAAVAEGLMWAHEKGVIHRDLKPDNIFLVGDEVKILDFGIAKVMSSPANTGTGALLGTPRYMAPEQCRGAKLVGPQSDVYSLGVILYEMITGQVPFDGEVTDILIKIITEQPVRPSELTSVSPEMEALILDCLAKDPAARPATMGALRERLAEWVGPASARPIRVATAPTLASPDQAQVKAITTLSQSAGEVSRSQPGIAAPAGGSRSRVGMVMGSVGAAALLIGGGYFALRSKGNGGTPTAVIAQKSDEPVAPTALTPTQQPKVIPAAIPVAATPVAAAPATTRFVVHSDPEGASVLDADNHVLGQTPKVLDVALPYEFWLKLDGYKPLKEAIAVREDAAQPFKLARLAQKPKAVAATPAPQGKAADSTHAAPARHGNEGLD